MSSAILSPNTRGRRLLFRMLPVVLGISPASFGADTLTVCPDGCAFSSIQRAIDAAGPGDTIDVRAGTYREVLRVEKDVILRGEDSRTTEVDGEGSSTVVRIGEGVAAAISDLTITGGAGTVGGTENDAGGVHNEGTLTLTNVVVEGNVAAGTLAGNGKGAGVRNDGDLHMVLCLVSGNHAAGRGGGIYNRAVLTLETTTVCGNSASGGGGIYNDEGRVEIATSAIADNTAAGDGGGLMTDGTCVLVNSTLSGNDAGENGGGILVKGALIDSRTHLIHCTVTDNRARGTLGGGIFNSSGAVVELERSIVARNDESTDCFGSIVSLGYNLDGDGSCGLDRNGEKPDQPLEDPRLGQLGHYGGPTLTHALESGSPAIDAAGDGASSVVAMDQRLEPRPVGGLCDTGAYERPSCEPFLPPALFRRGDSNDDGVLDLTDALVVLRYLFQGGAPLRCEDAGDVDDDGDLFVTDAVFLLDGLYRGGPPPPDPSSCGPDPTDDTLGCAALGDCRDRSAGFRDLWTSPEELRTKPTSGPAWEAVWDAARDACPGEATVTNQDSNANVQILAAAIVYARLSREDPETAGEFRDKVVGAIELLTVEGDPVAAHGCPSGCGKAVNESLAWGREVGAYVLAADLVGYRTIAFDMWLHDLADGFVACDGRTMVEAFEKRPNNWGVMNFGSLVAIYAYLGDVDQLSRVREYFVRGLNGQIPDCNDTDGAEPCFVWGGTRDPDEKDMTWHCDPSSPALISPPCRVTIGDGVELDLDGLIPDDQRRGCTLCPPVGAHPICAETPQEDRCTQPRRDAHISDWMNGAVMGARILERVGMSIWDSGDRAFKRMILAHLVTHCQLTCDDSGFQCESLYNCKDWVIPILDEAYDLQSELTPPPPTDCDCALQIAGRGTGASKNAGFGAYIVP